MDKEKMSCDKLMTAIRESFNTYIKFLVDNSDMQAVMHLYTAEHWFEHGFRHAVAIILEEGVSFE